MTQQSEPTNLPATSTETKPANKFQLPSAHFSSMIDVAIPWIEKSIPKHLDLGRLVRCMHNALINTPRLNQCTSSSFLSSMLTSLQLGLEVNTPLGLAYLIPYERSFKKDNQWDKVLECQFQMGYQGMRELSQRSGLVNSIRSRLVFQGDEFEYAYGLEEKLVHVPSLAPDREDDEKVKHVYAIVDLKQGRPLFEVLSIAQVHARRAHSASYKISEKGNGSSPWKNFYQSMVQKTAVRAVWKLSPRDTAMNIAYSLENDLDRDGGQHSWSDEVADALTHAERRGLIEAVGTETAQPKVRKQGLLEAIDGQENHGLNSERD